MRTVVVGPVLLVASTVPVAYAAWCLAGVYVRSRLARSALAVFGFVALTTLLLQVLGMAGLWNAWAQLVGAWLVGVAGVAAARRLATTTDDDRDPDDEPEAGRDDTTPVLRWLRLTTIGVPLAVGSAALLAAITQPDTANDSLLYHRGMLAWWVRTGTFWSIPSLENGASYEGGFWSNGELQALWGALPYGRDYLVQYWSLLWVVGTWLAVAAAARVLGAGRWTSYLTATGVVTCTVIGLGQLATLHVDIYPVMCATVMIWATYRWLRAGPDGDATRWLVLAGAGAGLAVGAKLFSVVFCGLWCAVVIVRALQRRRVGAAVGVAVAAVATAIAWPLRAWAATGNPLWPVGAGPLEAPEPVWRYGDRSIVGLAADSGLRPTLQILVVALVFAFGAFAFMFPLRIRQVWRWVRAERLTTLGFVIPLVGFAVYIVAPNTGQFVEQVILSQRYWAPNAVALLLSLAAASLTVATRVATSEPAESTRAVVLVHRAQRWFAASIVFGTLSIVVFHSLATFAWPWWGWLVGVAVGAVGAVWVDTGRFAEIGVRRTALAGLVAGLVVVAVAAPVKAANWYPYHPNLAYLTPVLDWLRTSSAASGSRIAFAGVYSGALPNRDLSNEVFWLGEPTDADGMRVWRDRDAWEAALVDACVDFLVVGSPSDATPLGTDFSRQLREGWGRPLPEWQWAQDSALLTEVTGNDTVRVYEVDRSGRPAQCRDVGPGVN